MAGRGQVNRPLILFGSWSGMTSPRKSPPLREILRDPRLALMLALGFSSGLPFLLIFSTQSAWLREAGSAARRSGS
jgi:PAT family beta-lactamase induction signal transducer AmpG